jgi:hypothetical protein
MRRWAIGPLCALAAWGAAAIFGRWLMPSYLAVWLFCLSIPAGAVALVMGLDLFGLGGPPQTAALRRLAGTLPAVALGGLPVLFFLPSLYPWAAHAGQGLAGRFFTPSWFSIRFLAILAVWSALALLFRRAPARPRPGWAGAGLSVHAVIATLAATDWIGSAAPGLNSAVLGVLFMAMQCGTAFAAAVLAGPARPRGAAVGLMLSVCVWAALHFVQYLVIWSADRPEQIVWYLRRGDATGVAVVLLGVAGLLLPLGLLATPGLAALPGIVTFCAALLCVVHLLEIFWLVTPSIRGGFTLAPPDLVGLACVLACAGLALRWARRTRQPMEAMP